MKLFLSSIAGVLALAAPAFAAAPDGGITANSTAPDTAQAQPKAEQRYCIQYEVTGSRLRHKACKTRNEWLAEGLDPLIR